MAEESPLEEAAKNAPQGEKKEGKEEEKPVGTLEGAVNELYSAGKNILAVSAEVASPFMFSGSMRTNAMINAYPLSIGARVDDIMAKKPVDNVKSAKESFVGTIITPPLAAMFKYIELGRQYVTNYAGAIPGGAAAVAGLAAGQAAFVAGYTGINHIVQNFSFKGLYQKFKKDYWPTLKNTWKYVLPLSSLNVLFLYKFGIAVQLAYSSLMSFLFRLVGPKTEGAKLSNLVYAMNPVPYIKGGLSAVSRGLSNLFGAPLRGAEAIGSALKDLYLKAPKPEAKPKASYLPSPALAPAYT